MSGPQHMRNFEQVQEPCASFDHTLVNTDSGNQNILINIDSDIVLETLEEGKDCNQPLQSPNTINSSASLDTRSPTCRNVNTIKFPGCFGFGVIFVISTRNSRTRNTEFSLELNKLFIDMDKWIELRIVFSNDPPQDLFIRALPIFAEATDIHIPVKRCPNHAREDHPSNQGFPSSLHLIRVDSSDAIYYEDLESGRLSVLVPLDPHRGGPQSSSCPLLMKFMCLGSDVGGINRRPLQVVFTLEDRETKVLGRDLVNVRICCCPKRDRITEEERVVNMR